MVPYKTYKLLEKSNNILSNTTYVPALWYIDNFTMLILTLFKAKNNKKLEFKKEFVKVKDGGTLSIEWDDSIEA